ncbi:MAG TPA: PepSY domain-containing protein [Steroidobacteraceae bacterium]
MVACALWPASVEMAVAAVSVTVAESGQSERELSAGQAEALVQKRYHARVVRAWNAEQDGRHLYVFRLLSAGGKVWNVRIDAHTGAEVP